MTREQLLNMSWVEWLAHLQERDDTSSTINAFNSKAVSTINEKIHAIKDHGFAEVSYQITLEENIKRFRERFRVYDAKRWY